MTDNFKNECKNSAYKNRLGKIIIGEETFTNSDYLSQFTVTDSCTSNNAIIGNTNNTTATFSLVKDGEYADKELDISVGVKYSDESTEYINLGKYIVSSESSDDTSGNSTYSADDYSSKLDTEYTYGINTETPTIADFYEDVCNQLGLTPETTEFTNSDIRLTGNPFTNKETCRTVLSNIAQVSCSFTIIDWDTNKIVLKWLESTSSETFTKEDYSTLEKNQVYGPVNCLVIQDTYTDGENVTKQDEESIEANGETTITIDNNYFLYTEELRKQAITAIWEKVNGLTYTDCTLTTYTGRPYLRKGSKITITENDGNTFDTYVLEHTFTYDGSFKSVISSPALTKTQVAMKNVVESTTTKFRKVERQVDKINGVIDDVVEMSEQLEKDLEIKKTLSGYPIYAINAGNYTIESEIIYGKCEQDGTPSVENPIEIDTLKGTDGILTQTITSGTGDDTNTNTVEIKIGDYELCKIGDITDIIDVTSGSIIKHIAKIESYDGEAITTDYISTTGELSTGATVYYVLDDPLTVEIEITGDNTLFKGTNTITLSDTPSRIDITYLTTSTFNETYTTRGELKVEKDSILAQTVSVSTYTDAIGTITTKLGDIDTNAGDIVDIKKSVQTLQDDDSKTISFIDEVTLNGVSKVKTETGYTFDSNGLHISDSTSDISSTLDNEGLEIIDKSGSSNEQLFYAGVGDNGESVVNTKNINIDKYLVMDKWRMEEVTDSTYGTGIGFFYLG